MSVFEKARELGRLINDSEQAKAKDTALEALKSNEAAAAVLNAYDEYRAGVEDEMRGGMVSQERFREITAEMKRLTEELQNNEITNAYIQSVKNLENLMMQVFDVIRGEVSEDFPLEGGGCGGGCGGCGGSCVCGS